MKNAEDRIHQKEERFLVISSVLLGVSSSIISYYTIHDIELSALFGGISGLLSYFLQKITIENKFAENKYREELEKLKEQLINEKEEFGAYFWLNKLQ